MKFLTFTSLLCFSFCFLPLNAQEVDFSSTQEQAELGDAEAQYRLGLFYDNAVEVEQDLIAAVNWYSLAAQQGHISAQFNLAQMYRFGDGVPRNIEQTIYWFSQAAEAGNDPQAQYVLGDIYRYGEGVEVNHNEAFRWYILAAEQTLVEAEYMTGILIAAGIGAPQNDYMALRWLRKAAKQGHARAFYALGQMYERGEGLDQSEEQNLFQAYVWYSVAAELNEAQAAIRLDVLAANMESELLSQAQNQSQTCILSGFQVCEQSL